MERTQVLWVPERLLADSRVRLRARRVALGTLMVSSGCCVGGTEDVGGYRRPIAFVEVVSGCPAPSSAEDVSVYVDAYWNTLLDARFDAPARDVEVFLQCWETHGGSVDEASHVHDGYFGDHRVPELAAPHAHAGSIRVAAPATGSCDMVTGLAPSGRLERVYLRCTLDGADERLR